jgi:hypothetical protein
VLGKNGHNEAIETLALELGRNDEFQCLGISHAVA